MSRFYSNNRGLAPLIIIIASAIVLITIPVAIYLVGQSQEIRKKAADNDLICQAIPSKNVAGTVGEIRVTNNTTTTITLRTQQNRCAYKTYTGEPPNCNENPSQKLETVTGNGGTKIIPAWVPANCEETQLDVWNETFAGAKCYDPASGRFWDSAGEVGANALAFVKVANKGTYPNCDTTPTTPPATATPTATGAPTATVTPTGTRTPTATPTRTPTPPPGSTPTNTPRPTNTPVPPAATAPPGVMPTNTPKPPVSGGIAPTVITIIGGGLLILVGLIL